MKNDERFYAELQQKHRFQDELIVENKIVAIEEAEKPEPHILILSSGEMTPFEWVIEDRESRYKMHLKSNLLGKIVMTGPEEMDL